MEPLIASIVGVGAVALVVVAANDGATATETVWGRYFVGHRPDPWPHGVQEEDRTTRWGVPDTLDAQSAPVADSSPQPVEEELLTAPAEVTARPVRAVVRRVA